MITPRNPLPLPGMAIVSMGLLLALALGCSGRLDPEKYGEVVTELPHVKGVERPYPLPELKQEPEKEAEAPK